MIDNIPQPYKIKILEFKRFNFEKYFEEDFEREYIQELEELESLFIENDEIAFILTKLKIPEFIKTNKLIDVLLTPLHKSITNLMRMFNARFSFHLSDWESKCFVEVYTDGEGNNLFLSYLVEEIDVEINKKKKLEIPLFVIDPNLEVYNIRTNAYEKINLTPIVLSRNNKVEKIFLNLQKQIESYYSSSRLSIY